MKYTIGNEELELEVESFGAEPVSMKLAGKERLWQNDNGSWAGHSPVLFPVCGHCGVTVAGKSYPIRAHGFAKRCEFALKERGDRSLTFTLASSPETKAVYPYEFELSVRYTLHGNRLETAYTVENTGDRPLYFACGGHPSFALEGEIGDYAIDFGQEERFLNRVHDTGGYLTGETQDLGTGKTLPLKEEYFFGESTLIFADTRSKRVTLQNKAGKAVAAVEFEGFGNLLLWKPQGAKMLCVEPWTNLPDSAGEADREFSEKCGVISVACGKRAVRSFTIAYF